MLFSLKNLGKVIAVRFRKNRQNNSVPVPVATPGVLFSPALPSDSSAGHVVSARIERRAPVFTVGISDRVQVTLAGVQGIAGPIPLVGSPLQAAINGLLTVLQTFDRHAQNRAVIASIRRRLHRLWRYLCNAPSAHDGAEQSRRDELISLLQDTSDQLAELDNGGLVYQSVTQALAGFSAELDHYLAEYAFAVQMNTQNDVVETRTQLQQFIGSTAMDLRGTVTRHCLILEDATGKEHKIPMEFCMSLPQLNNMLKVLFTPNTDKACIQRRYLEQGQYDLCIDRGTQVIELTSETDEWSMIEAGTKVVMRVIIDKDVYSASAAIKCDACGCAKYSVQPAGIKGSRSWMICCQGCERRYQVTIPSRLHNGDGTIPRATDPKGMRVIRNMHVRERVVRDLILRAHYTMLTEPLPCSTLRSKNRNSSWKDPTSPCLNDDHSSPNPDDQSESNSNPPWSSEIDDLNQCLSKQALRCRHEDVLANPPSNAPIQYRDHMSSGRSASFRLLFGREITCICMCRVIMLRFSLDIYIQASLGGIGPTSASQTQLSSSQSLNLKRQLYCTASH